MIAQLIGAAPRYFRQSRRVQVDAPKSWWFTIASEIFCPNAMTTITSAGGSFSAFDVTYPN